MFQTKKSFITCLKLMINELARFPTSSENVYFANNEQASIAVFTTVFCFGSSLENYTSSNTRQYDTTRIQHEVTRVQHDITRVQHKPTRV